MRLSRSLPPLLVVCLLGACATAPPVPTRAPPSGSVHRSEERVVTVAQGLLGTPYHYGGTTPTSGFDCSGFVQYVYRQVGVTLPRTAAAQRHAVRSVRPEELQAGDLLFFRISRNKVSHVAIYLASGRFIHAPSTGKGVSTASLRQPYWSARLIGAGRVF